MKKLLIGLIVFGASAQLYAQEPKVEALKEVIVGATNYKYLDKVSTEDDAMPVRQLERMAATYNMKDLDIYEDEYDFYDVSFVIPEGVILASYDKDGKILQTVEKFKNTDLPGSVTNAIITKFPGWVISKNVYLVYYHDLDRVQKKYKITLEKGDQRIKVKTDDLGHFI